MDTRRPPSGAVVAGFDGSSSGDTAVDWAARQASLEHAPLVVVHAEPLLGAHGLGWLDATGIDHARLRNDLRDDGQGLLRSATSRAHRVDPELAVTRLLSPEDPRTALLDLAADARMLVVGSRGRGPVADLVLGSVNMAAARHASCPVVVARPAVEEPREGVVVGIDGSPCSDRVIRVAAGLADVRALPLTVLHCVWDVTRLRLDEHVVPEHEAGHEEERRLLASVVTGLAASHPGVRVRTELARGSHHHHLTRLSQTAALVVVGSPRLVEAAACSVAVVPADA